MKRILSFSLALMMLLTLFTGCGCMDQNVSTHPSGVITESTSAPTIVPHPTATHATEPKGTEATTGPSATDATGTTGMTGEASQPTDSTTVPRARGRVQDQTR